MKPDRPRRSINNQPAVFDTRFVADWLPPEVDWSMDDDIRQQLEAQRYAEAFDLMLPRYQDKVFRLAFSMMHNETQAEDVAQDVFVKIWKALPGYHGGAALSTWIYTITRNTCLTELKKRSTRPTISLHEPDMEAVADTIPALQSRDCDAGTEMDVAHLLAQLPEKYRRIITLFYLEQKAYNEVAALLGIPLGTVKTLLFRAKKELLRIGARRPAMISTAPVTSHNKIPEPLIQSRDCRTTLSPSAEEKDGVRGESTSLNFI